MTMVGGLGLFVLVAFAFLMVTLALVERRWPARFRPIPAFDALGVATERAVEAGERVHFSLGTGTLLGGETGPALAGLSMLNRVAEAATMSDRPPVVTAADGALVILAQDSIRAAYRRARAVDRYHASSGRLVGATPLSYAAGIPAVLNDEDASVHLMVGGYGVEGALVADVGQRKQAFTLGGTQDVQSQALLFATAENPLVGEDVFAGGAYLNVGLMHRGSLRTQDLVRVLIVTVVLVGTLLKTFGVIP
ncbi:MAG: hypothetical protein MUO23_06900 [Anaerolineales bacterium]|nr:hypothetical protein [Anaerolineales bacterium]